MNRVTLPIGPLGTIRPEDSGAAQMLQRFGARMLKCGSDNKIHNTNGAISDKRYHQQMLTLYFLAILFIDQSKAFDRVSHEWVQ